MHATTVEAHACDCRVCRDPLRGQGGGGVRTRRAPGWQRTRPPLPHVKGADGGKPGGCPSWNLRTYLHMASSPPPSTTGPSGVGSSPKWRRGMVMVMVAVIVIVMVMVRVMDFLEGRGGQGA